MTNEIVYVCNSINNKNVRGSELKILRKNEEELWFEFGESESNIKRRFYRNIDVLNKDYEAVREIKEEIEAESRQKEAKPEITSGYAEVLEPMKAVEVETFKRKKGKKSF